jgi:hypothetical protein
MTGQNYKKNRSEIRLRRSAIMVYAMYALIFPFINFLAKYLENLVYIEARSDITTQKISNVLSLYIPLIFSSLVKYTFFIIKRIEFE